MKNKICEHCGKIFEVQDRVFKHTKYCCKQCQYEAQKLNQRNRYYEKIKKFRLKEIRKKHEKLADINKKAKELGLSYGEYVALTETNYDFKFKEGDKNASECEVK